MTVARALALALAFAALLAPPAHAGADQLSMMMDDDLLVYRDDATRDRTLRAMKQIGVDYVRVTVLWSVVAEGARETRQRRRRFSPSVPRTYPIRNWDRYDNLVRSARALNMGVYFNVTGPGPSFAHRTPPRERGLRSVVRRAWKPRPADFGRFVRAVGRRYSGRYRDENADRGLLPRVSFWSLWNEPNQAGWLAPQWEGGKSYAPRLYAQLYRSGREALRRSGHDGDVILFGETAPLGSSRRTFTSPMRPKAFLRALAAATRGTGRIKATGYGHHPYTKNVGPTTRDRHRDSITMANIGELGTTLDQLSRRTRGRLPGGVPLYMTEFGFETNPPDPFSGVPLDRQAEWNTLGELLAFTNPRIKSMTQFLLRDVPPVRRQRPGTKAYWFTYQSGLFTAGGQPKPSAIAYALPFVTVPIGTGPSGLSQYAFWGQLRFRPNGAPSQVSLQWRPADGSADWATLADPLDVPAGLGFFQAVREIPAGGLVRAAWTDGASVVASRELPVG